MSTTTKYKDSTKTLGELLTTLMTSPYSYGMENIEVLTGAYMQSNELKFKGYLQLLAEFPQDCAYMITPYDTTEEYFFESINRNDVNLNIVRSLVDMCVEPLMF